MSLRISEEEYAKLLHRQTLQSYQAPSKKSKYRNEKVCIEGIVFDSKKEGARYRQLKMLEDAGKISALILQPVFYLAPSVVIAGKKKPALRYVADFQYREGDKIITEDVKGVLTDVYVIKKHLMKHIFDIDILET